MELYIYDENYNPITVPFANTLMVGGHQTERTQTIISLLLSGLLRCGNHELTVNVCGNEVEYTPLVESNPNVYGFCHNKRRYSDMIEKAYYQHTERVRFLKETGYKSIITSNAGRLADSWPPMNIYVIDEFPKDCSMLKHNKICEIFELSYRTGIVFIIATSEIEFAHNFYILEGLLIPNRFVFPTTYVDYARILKCSPNSVRRPEYRHFWFQRGDEEPEYIKETTPVIDQFSDAIRRTIETDSTSSEESSLDKALDNLSKMC